MRQALLITGIITTLLLSGWNGALASVMCAHNAGHADAVQREHACCRKTAGDESAHCAMTAGEAGDVHDGEPSAQHEAGAMSHEVGHAATSQHRDDAGDGIETQTQAVLQPADPCAHCMGRSGLPPASAKLREAGIAKRVEDIRAAREERRHEPRLASFITEITPSQGAPPGLSDSTPRYVLFSIFLI